MSLNWERLVGQGRARDTGIAWQPEEWELVLAIAKKNSITVSLAAEFVRKGATLENFAEVEPPKPREVIEKEAKEAGVSFAPEAPTAVLEKEIIRKTKKVKKSK